MSQRTKIIFWIILVIIIFGGIFLIWAYDTGRIASHADVANSNLSPQDLKELPSPDQSTFSKLFTVIIKPFIK